MKKLSYQFLCSYLLGLFFLYPIVAHVLMYQFGFMADRLPHGPLWIYVQIYLSGPALVLIGALLYFKYGQHLLNKIAGALFLSIGLYWIYTVISDIIKEAL